MTVDVIGLVITMKGLLRRFAPRNDGRCNGVGETTKGFLCRCAPRNDGLCNGGW